MTEIKGGSDLGAAVETIARPEGDGWRLSGEKYFTSNAGAELAVVAARPEGASAGVRGLALFLVPRYRQDGELNYFVRRLKDKIATRSVPTGEVELKDSEGYLLGSADSGIYLILEVLNLSRVANSVVSVALAQRAMVGALSYAEQVAFTIFKLHFSCRNGARCNLVLQPPDKIVELAILAVSRHQEQSQPAHTRCGTFGTRRDNG